MKRHNKGGLVRDDCPPAILDVATRRVLPHITHLQMVDFDIHQLAVNCYMQGLNDMACSLINKGMIADASIANIKPNEKVLEYEI